MPPLPLEHRPRQQPGASLLVRYFMIPCNICLILLATSTLGFAVLLFLSNCMWLLDVLLSEPLISVTKGFRAGRVISNPGVVVDGAPFPSGYWIGHTKFQSFL